MTLGPLPLILVPSYMLWGTCALFSSPGQDPAVVLGFSECFLCMVLCVWHVACTIYFRLAGGEGMSTEFESQLCLMLFSIHFAKFFLEKIFTGQVIVKAEVYWALCFLAVFSWEYVHHHDDIFHHVLVCWSIVDYLRCLVTWSRFRGYAFVAKLAPVFSWSFVAILLVPMFASIIHTKSYDWFALGYTVFVLFSASPSMDRELQAIGDTQPARFDRSIYDLLKQHRLQTERNLLTFQEEEAPPMDPPSSSQLPSQMLSPPPMAFTSSPPSEVRVSPRPVRATATLTQQQPPVNHPPSGGLNDLAWDSFVVPPPLPQTRTDIRDDLSALFGGLKTHA